MSKLFQGGVPTEADVKKLIQEWPDMKPGDVATYAQVATIIGAEYGTGRFRSVTIAWRRLVLRTQNYVIEAVPGVGFRRQTEVDRSQANRAGWRRDQSRAARKVRDLTRTDTRDFSELEQRTHDHARRVLQAHVEHTASTARELAPPAPLALLPKRSAK